MREEDQEYVKDDMKLDFSTILLGNLLI